MKKKKPTHKKKQANKEQNRNPLQRTPPTLVIKNDLKPEAVQFRRAGLFRYMTAALQQVGIKPVLMDKLIEMDAFEMNLTDHMETALSDQEG